MICDALFLQILPKLHLITPYFSLRAPVGSASAWQTRSHGFEPVLVLEFFFVSQPVGRGFEPLLRHTFFVTSVSRKTSRCSAGVLLTMESFSKSVINYAFHQTPIRSV